MNEPPAAMVALGNALGEYFKEHHEEFDVHGKVDVSVQIGRYIEIACDVQCGPFIVRMMLDHRGEWRVLESTFLGHAFK